MRLQRRRVLAAAAGSLWLPGLHAQTEERLHIAGSHILLQMDDSLPPELMSTLRPWVRAAAEAVAGYLGRFPLPQVELLVVAGHAAPGVQGGTTYAEPTPFMRVRVGRHTQPRDLVDDWVLVHEMVHLAVPRVPRHQSWLQEGIATYVEGMARVRAGRNTPQRLWAELVRGLPQGQPQAGDRGLDHTATWGRTYWGGALFCLLADVRLLQQTGLRAGLRQALQGVLAAGGSYAVAWPVPRILEVADEAAGAPVLSALYAEMKDSSHAADLPALWRELGVSVAGEDRAARLDDRAPLAAVRRLIA
jgi:hypothetical protein